jgi:hypothetical protein
MMVVLFQIVPVSPQAAAALPRVAGGRATLVGHLGSDHDAEHDGTLLVSRVARR